MTATTDTDSASRGRTAAHAAEPPRSGRVRRLWRGRADDPRWARPALLALLAVTAIGYLWDLAGNGYANTFYAAAVQAGTESWKAWLFGALDAPGTITVDKPPAAMWVMALSGRLFGFSSWSLLAPQALMGVAAVALVYATVRRLSGPRTALGAAGLLAVTPIAALMSRLRQSRRAAGAVPRPPVTPPSVPSMPPGGGQVPGGWSPRGGGGSGS